MTASLAARIAERRTNGEEAPILVMGAEVGAAAGAPTAAEVGRMLFDQLRDVEVTEEIQIPAPDADDATVAHAFHTFLTTLPPIQRASFALETSASVPVPQFLQDLALLIREGMFPTVVTTNFDALLERALAGAGLRTGADMRVVDVGAATPTSRGDDGEPLVTLFKLHGHDLGTQDAIPGVDLSKPAVVVGRGGGDPAIVDGLAYGGGPVWWVSEQPLVKDELTMLERAREVTTIAGESATPDRFFGELAMLLLQVPTLNVLARPADALKTAKQKRVFDTITIDTGLGSAAGPDPLSSVFAEIGGTSPPDDDAAFERQFVEWRLARCRRAVARLERQAAGGSVDDALRSQLDYQRRELAELEQQLHAIEATWELVREVLNRIKAAPEAKRDPETEKYVDNLVDQIDLEFSRPEPNDAMISANLGALSIFANRIGIEPRLVRELTQPFPVAEWKASL